MNREEMKEWIEENVVSSADAHEYTGQTPNAFASSYRRGKIHPFVVLAKNNRNTTKLFLKEDLLNYGKHLKIKKE